MARTIRREEMVDAVLNLGGPAIELADYATTGLVGVAVGPRGNGKTNAALLVAEQLAAQGWVSVLIDPEEELEALYGQAVADAEELSERLRLRDQSIVVVRARDATEFIPYAEALLEAADAYRKPVLVVLDEGQLFSSARKRDQDVGRASDLVNEFVGRGRKRALDLFITALRATGTLHRSVFTNKNLSLMGCQEDPTVWSSLSAQFRPAGISFEDLSALQPGEFYCMSRRGVEKVRMPMAEALKRAAAPKARKVRKTLPGNFAQWSRAMSEIPTRRLAALQDPALASLLGTVAGLTRQQMIEGGSALQEELAAREIA